MRRRFAQTETYHGGREITYTPDAIGRVKAVSGTKSGVATVYAGSTTNTDDEIKYAAHGALSQMRVGDGSTETWGWNYRLQPSSISHGTMSLTYYYCPGTATSCTTNDGNVASQVIGQAGNATQAYSYL